MGFLPSQVGFPISLEVAHKSWTCVSYTSSAGLTFPEPQGSSQSVHSSGTWFLFLAKEKESDIGQTRSCFYPSERLSLEPLKHYSVVNVLQDVV